MYAITLSTINSKRFAMTSAREGVVRPSLPVGDPTPDKLLAAWLTQEVLTPQPLPELKDLVAVKRQRFPLNGPRAPWCDSANWTRAKETSVFWFLYLGEIDIATVTEALSRSFPDQNEGERVPPRGSTTMAGLAQT